MSIVFKKIENGNIFTRDFSPLVRNSEIVFPTSEEIAVIYGPNGTGKTSLIKVLDGSQGTKVEFTFEETDYTNGSQIFHVINEDCVSEVFFALCKWIIKKHQAKVMEVLLEFKE